jgi:hypothetical protein
MTKERSKGARLICLTASIRELGLFDFFFTFRKNTKGEVVKEVFAYGTPERGLFVFEIFLIL